MPPIIFDFFGRSLCRMASIPPNLDLGVDVITSLIDGKGDPMAYPRMAAEADITYLFVSGRYLSVMDAPSCESLS